MPYDFSLVEAAIKKCAAKSDWRDKQMKKLEHEYLFPLEHDTATLSSLIIELNRFMRNVKSEFEEIMKTY